MASYMIILIHIFGFWFLLTNHVFRLNEIERIVRSLHSRMPNLAFKKLSDGSYNIYTR